MWHPEVLLASSFRADLGMLVQHLRVLFLIVGMPLWDWYEIPRLKASPDPREKVRCYLEDRHGLLGLDGGGRAFDWSLY
jgi:hypothetical protein